MQKLLHWIDARFPLTALWESQWGKYIAPKNFNFWYYFGSLALFVLVLQIVTGIFLTMNYKPSAAEAFASVEYIMRDVDWGWLIRYLHSTGASAFDTGARLERGGESDQAVFGKGRAEMQPAVREPLWTRVERVSL